jgi:dihydropteroate synthase
MIFRAREFKYIFPRPALVMGIVNATPDSFFDGGKFFDAGAAAAHALELIDQGADILDLGGESTRPGAVPVEEKEECRRVIPVIKKLVTAIKTGKARPTAISIDTMKPGVARAALEAGASMVNDVAAGRDEDAMWRVVSEFRAGYVVMHAPPGLHGKPGRGGDIARQVGSFFSERFKTLKACGLAPEQIVFDPGIGFGKNLEQNLQLLACLGRFTKLRRPLLLGVSRKSFIGKLFGVTVNERLPASLACAILGIASGANIIRAHDIAETVQAVRMAEAVLSRQN